MYGAVSYLIISELASLLDTGPGAVAFLGALTVFLLGFGGLLCILVRRGNRHERRIDENTHVLPSVRAGKLRRKYLR